MSHALAQVSERLNKRHLTIHIHIHSHMVAERDYPRTSERIERLIVDALIPLILEETVDVVRLISQEHIQRRMVEEPVGVSVPQDAIEDCNKDQLSNTTARIEAVEKSISELHERVTKDTKTRQKQHSEVMTLIANNAAATELLKLTDEFLSLMARKMKDTDTKEDLEADTAKHSSVLETAVSRSTMDGEVSSRDQISQYTMEMVKQLVEVPKTISQNRIQQRTMKQIVDDPVVQVVQIPQVHVVEKTAEIPVMTQRQNHMVQTVQMPMETPQLQIVGEIVRDTQTSDSLGTTPVCQVAQTGHVEAVEIETSLPTESASAMFVSTPVPQAMEELVEASKVFSQDRVQQRFGKQTIEPPAISLAERVVEAFDTRTQDKTQHVVNTHVQHVVNTVEAETPVIIETINQVTKHVEIPQLQIVNVPGSQAQEETVSQDRMSDRVVQQTVKELKSKFEVGHTNKVTSRTRIGGERNRSLRPHSTLRMCRRES